MTTIVANKECMAADTQVTHNGLVTKETKIFKVRGDIVGMAGDSQDGLAFLEWYRGGSKPDDIGEDFEALALTPDGLFWYGKRLIPEPVTTKYYSIGSGSHVAIGLMIAGYEPKEAIEEACKWLNESSKPVQILYLK